jgi:hypothetical protein
VDLRGEVLAGGAVGVDEDGVIRQRIGERCQISDLERIRPGAFLGDNLFLQRLRWLGLLAGPRPSASKTSKTPLDTPEFFMASPITTSRSLAGSVHACLGKRRRARALHKMPSSAAAAHPTSALSRAGKTCWNRCIRLTSFGASRIGAHSSRYDRPLPRRSSIRPPPPAPSPLPRGAQRPRRRASLGQARCGPEPRTA